MMEISKREGGNATEMLFNSARHRNTDPKSAARIWRRKGEREQAWTIPVFCVWSQSQAP